MLARSDFEMRYLLATAGRLAHSMIPAEVSTRLVVLRCEHKQHHLEGLWKENTDLLGLLYLQRFLFSGSKCGPTDCSNEFAGNAAIAVAAAAAVATLGTLLSDTASHQGSSQKWKLIFRKLTRFLMCLCLPFPPYLLPFKVRKSVVQTRDRNI